MDAQFFRENAVEEQFDIRIDRDGQWFHRGSTIGRDKIAKLFSTVLHYDPNSKDYWLITPVEQGRIEVEDVLYRHPAVLAAAVVAKPDERWGETPCAFVELKEGAVVEAADIVAHCKQHLAGFKVPRAVEFGELPKTSTGKIQKFELRLRVGSIKAIDT